MEDELTTQYLERDEKEKRGLECYLLVPPIYAVKWSLRISTLTGYHGVYE
jgi:hypothetical protein